MYLSSIDQALKEIDISQNDLDIMCDLETENKELDFWTKRALKYNKLQWAVNDEYLKNFLNAGLFHNEDTVLDIGTGTGIVANELSRHVKHVCGVDISPDMLSQAAANKKDNQEFVLGDASCMSFEDNTFTKITARMVFHHLIDKAYSAISECYRVLKEDGLIILSEGIPPHRCVEQFYQDIFVLKEERLTFFEEDLVSIIKSGGFEEIKVHEFYLKGASVRNWLDNSGLDPSVQTTIYDMHFNLHNEGKRAYNMKISEGDIKIDMKFLIFVGRKVH